MGDQVLIYLWVSLGSALGGAGRYWVSSWSIEKLGASFPWGTLIVNVSGSFVIGCLAALTSPTSRLDIHPRMSHFLIVGLCGGFTTFSTFSLQTLTMIQSGHWMAALSNCLVSVLSCLGAVYLGYLIGQSFN